MLGQALLGKEPIKRPKIRRARHYRDILLRHSAQVLAPLIQLMHEGGRDA